MINTEITITETCKFNAPLIVKMTFQLQIHIVMVTCTLHVHKFLVKPSLIRRTCAFQIIKSLIREKKIEAIVITELCTSLSNVLF